MSTMSIMTSDGRRAWSFIALVGAAMVFTLFAAFAVWNVRGHPQFSFWLGLAAHGQVFGVLAALGWVLGRRMMASATRDGVSLDDRDPPPPAPPAPPVAWGMEGPP